MPRKDGKKQTRLTFAPVTPAENSPPSSRLRSKTSPLTPARLRYSGARTRGGQLRLDAFVESLRQPPEDVHDGDGAYQISNENGLPTPASHGNKFSNYKSHNINSISNNTKRRFEDLDSDTDDLLTPARRRRRLLVSSDSESESKTPPSPSVSSKATSSEESEDSDMPRRSIRRAPSRRLREKDSNDDSSDRSRSPSERRLERGARARRVDATPRRRDSKQSGLDDEESSTPKSKGRASRPKRSMDDFIVDDDEEEDVVAYTPTRTRRPRRVSGGFEMSEQDKMDLENDLRDLKGSDVIEPGMRRNRVGRKASKVQEGLERLRRRRAGQKELSDEDEVSSSGQPDAAEDDDSDEDLGTPADEDLDQYEEDFVEEEEDAELGVPHAEMPFEFTRHAYKDLRECFRDVVEWMVHNKLNPAFARDDPMYGFAFRKLEDEVRGRVGSQFVSSTWNAKFTRTLQARPYMDITGHPTAENNTCDACNRSKHPASAEIRLQGKPYSLETLEPLTDSDESDEESEEETCDSEERGDRDSDGHLLYDENTRFLLGRTCRANAEMAHTLAHWRFHLNEWVIEYLKNEGLFEAESILERERMNRKKRSRLANQVVDKMEESGEIKKLWRDFHINLKAARDRQSSA